MNQTICKNCDNRFEGQYCNVCGQSSKVERINSHYLMNEISNNFFQLDRGFFFTARALFTRPGQCVGDFLMGKRRRYAKPLTYLLLTATLYAIVTYLLGLNTFSQDFATGFAIGVSDKGSEHGHEIVNALNWLAEKYAYTVLFTLPFFSLGSYVAFFKSGHNYFEHVILNMYITGQQMLVYLCLSFFVIKDNMTEILPLAGGIIFNFWAFYQFFKIGGGFTKLLLTLVTYGLFMVQMLGLITIGVILIDELHL